MQHESSPLYLVQANTSFMHMLLAENIGALFWKIRSGCRQAKAKELSGL